MERRDNLMIARVLACVGVIAVHMGQRLELTGGARIVTDLGQYGLLFFFIISGYLACCSKELAMGKNLLYWKKRAIRILPLYYLMVIIYYIGEEIVFGTMPPDATGWGWKRYLFFLYGFIGNEERVWINIGFTWTIPVFLLFYLSAPLLYRWINSWNKALIGMGIFYVISLVVLMWGNGNFISFAYFHFFLLGFVLYYSEREGKKKNTVEVIVVLLGILLVMRWAGYMFIANEDFIYGLLLCFMVLISMPLTVKKGLFKTILVKLDQYSFTIYMSQGIVFEEILRKRYFEKRYIFLIGILGTLAVAIIINRFFEKPLSNYLLGLGKKKEM